MQKVQAIAFVFCTYRAYRAGAVVNFYAGTPAQIKSERFAQNHRIVHKNPEQMHLVPGWEDRLFEIYA